MVIWAPLLFFDRNSPFKSTMSNIGHSAAAPFAILIALPWIAFYGGTEDEIRWAKNSFVRGISLYWKTGTTGQYYLMQSFKYTLKRMTK